MTMQERKAKGNEKCEVEQGADRGGEVATPQAVGTQVIPSKFSHSSLRGKRLHQLTPEALQNHIFVILRAPRYNKVLPRSKA